MLTISSRRRTPNRRYTSRLHRSINVRTSPAEARPSLTMKLPCVGDTRAWPSRAPLRPARSTSAPESGQGFHDYLDLNIEAEALGYHSSFLVEHHFSGWNQISATLTLLTCLAMRTTTLRLGSAVMVLPWHHPVLLAEQAAMLDVMSAGRLDFGIGKGYRYNEFRGFNIPREEADARFEDALAVITKAWTSRKRFTHQSKFWTFNDIVVEPPPAQQPHPPFWVAAGSEASIKRAAARG